MTNNNSNNNKIFTIPNILSIMRVAILPLIVYIYMFSDHPWIAGILTILSGVTDLIDGYIARRFNQISNLGKILDPIADKLTLLIVFICVAIKNPIMILLLGAELIKDIFVLISSSIRVFYTKEVHCAEWEGKVCTALAYLSIISHMLFNISWEISSIWIISVSSLILLLGILYIIENIFKINHKNS